MSTADSDLGSPAKLPVWQTVKAGYGETTRNFGAFLTAAAVPFALSVTLAAVMAEAPERRSLTLLRSLLEIMIIAVFEVAWYRHLLLKSPEARPRLLPRPGRRLVPYLGYAWLLGAASFPALIAMEPFAEGPGSALQIAIVIVLVGAALYLNIRFTFAFIWIAVDESGRLGDSWRRTKGNGLRLLAALTLIAMLILGVLLVGIFLLELVFPDTMIMTRLGTTDAGSGLHWVSLTSGQALTYLLYGVSCAAFVQALRSLGGWTGDQREILERFD